MAFVPGDYVSGSTLSSWTPLRSPTRPELTTWFHASSGKMIDYNSTRNTASVVNPGTTRRAAIMDAFRDPIRDALATAAVEAAGTGPTTPRAGAGGAGASSIPVIPSGSSGSGSGGASGSPRNFGAREAKYSYYPEDLATTKQDRIKFEMRAAGTRGGRISGGDPGGSGLLGFGPRSEGRSLGIVFLGIQGQISDSNSVDWSGSTINPLQAALAEASINAMQDPELSKDVAGLMGSLGKKIFDKAKTAMRQQGVRNNLQILLAQEAVQAQGLLSRLGGQVANPNLELLFNGPQLRPFTFNFRMTPRSGNEANRVKKIIRFFKEGMAVQTTETDIFLKSPNTFKIQFQSGESSSNAHTSLPRIKECALIRCDVNYTPDGSYMTFADSIEGYPMTCYELSLAFSEIDPIVGEDYSDLPFEGPNMEIGY